MANAGKMLFWYMVGESFRKAAEAVDRYAEASRPRKTPKDIKKIVRQTLHEIRRKR